MWRTVNNTYLEVNDQGKLYSRKSKRLIGKISRKEHPYWIVTVNNKTEQVHRLVAKAFPEICGEWFEGCEVHHKDGNSLNNEATNLIVCTKEQHLEYHRLFKEKKKKDEEMVERLKETPEEKIKRLLNTGFKVSLKLYCRKSKIRKDGTAPIELSVSQKGERHFVELPFRTTPEKFAKGTYPEGFVQYFNTFPNETNIHCKLLLQKFKSRQKRSITN